MDCPPVQNQSFDCTVVQLKVSTGAHSGLLPMVRHKAVLERYAALRCLWIEVHDDERSNGHTVKVVQYRVLELAFFLYFGSLIGFGHLGQIQVSEDFF
eukprot:1144949-Prymnesium_polylepis.1